MDSFDLVVIGSGPAGYTGAIRAAQLGMKVACIEKRDFLGGTCLNVGCIPSKALLNYSEKFYEAKHVLKNYGIKTSVELELTTMLNKKNKVVTDLCKGIELLFIKNKVTKFQGLAKILSSSEIQIINQNQRQIITAKNILIATGSEPVTIQGVEIDETKIVSSTGALNLSEVPKSLVVIGGGYIGLELGSVWNRLGSYVTVIESTNKITPGLDAEISANFIKILQKQGIEFQLNTKLVSVTKKINQVELVISADNVESSIITDIVLVAVGRRPFSRNLGLSELGISRDAKGYIKVNQNFQVSKYENIYAVGDVINGPMLAHKAEEEAIVAVELIAGCKPHINNYNLIPSVVYTSPEVASVGMTEEQLKAKNIPYKIGKFPFIASSRAQAVNATEGFVKILADANSDLILGAHIIGKDAGTLIAEIALGMVFNTSSEDIARTCHAHPTLNEAVKEAALAVDKRSINF